MPIPKRPKIYHIVHVNRLPSIIKSGCLWSDSEVERRKLLGTNIGMNNIKHRRLNELTLASHPQLYVGDCVPFYFCPRSIMLYMIHQANNPELDYHRGQKPIIHLEADLFDMVNWANNNNRCWALTTSNAGSRYFEDFSELDRLDKIDWDAVITTNWRDCKEGKQAEFLIEKSFPIDLLTRIGVYSNKIMDKVQMAITAVMHKPFVEIKREWYY